MNWNNCEQTNYYLENHLPQDFVGWELAENQYPGRNFNHQSWYRRVLENGTLLDYHISSPENIMDAFQQGRFLAGLALVVSWGTMWRRPEGIYTAELNVIEATLSVCYEEIQDSESIEQAWAILENDLKWSNVMISKTLHFMCRALGFTIDTPVALDNAVILEQVWPTLVRYADPQIIPDNWRDGYEGYSRYMTFINNLRENHYPGWTNTDIEATLFTRFYPR